MSWFLRFIRGKKNKKGNKNDSAYRALQSPDMDDIYSNPPDMINNNVEIHHSDNNILESILTEDVFLSKYKLIRIMKQKPYKIIATAMRIEDNDKVLIKVRKVNDIAEDDEMVVLNIIKKNPSRLVQGFIEVLSSGDVHCFVYEYIDWSRLDIYIKENKIEPDMLNRIFRNLINGVDYIHSLGLLHRDIKADNILVNKDTGEVIIIDFDISVYAPGKEYIDDKAIGTPLYIAPESCDLNIYSRKSDIWSIGILLYIMITKRYPHDKTMLETTITARTFKFNEFKEIDYNLLDRCVREKRYDKRFIDIIHTMLTFEYDKRPEMKALINEFRELE